MNTPTEDADVLEILRAMRPGANHHVFEAFLCGEACTNGHPYIHLCAAELRFITRHFNARQERAVVAETERLRAELDSLRLVSAAVQEWAGNNEGLPSTPTDAELIKALWTFEGDRTEPCPECDGECGEPCAPCTVAQAHGQLDAWVRGWHRDHLAERVLAEEFVAALAPPTPPVSDRSDS